MSQLNHIDPQLQQQLSALTSAAWQQQIEIIQSLPHNTQLIRLINLRNYSSDIASLLAGPNPRSRLVVVLCEFLSGLFSLHCNQLLGFVNVLMGGCLLRLLGSGNRVVAGAVNEVLKCIIANTDFSGRGKQVRFVAALEEEFLGSKNSFVREKISMYFEVIVASGYYSKEGLLEFEGRVVRKGLEDGCEKVRKNMRKVLENAANYEKQNMANYEKENVSQYEKENQLQEVASRRVGKDNEKKYQSKTKGPRVVYSSVNQSSILQNFMDSSQDINYKDNQSLQLQQMSQNNYLFYLDRLRSGDSWPMTTLAYEQLQVMLKAGSLSRFRNESITCQTLSVLIPFLAQKRGKMYDSCCEAMVSILEGLRGECGGRVMAYLQEHVGELVEYAVKGEGVGSRLLPLLVELNPSFFVFKLAEVSQQLKVSKERLLVLDTIMKCLDLLYSQHQTSRTNKKVGAIVKMMCEHIVNGGGRDREVGLAALAVISHLKSRYPDDVLTTLLCQSDKVLSKIIEMADSIDEGLRVAVIQYISALKGDGKKGKGHGQSKRESESEGYAGQIERELKKVKQQQCTSLHRLGQLYLTNLQQITLIQFRRLLAILEFLCENDMVMQFRIILAQIAKSGTRLFVQALMEILQEGDNGEAGLREHHDLLFMDILGLALRHLEGECNGLLIRVGTGLIKIYRKSESLKVRSLIIENLTVIPEEVLQDCLQERERELVRAYREKLNEEEDSS